ncbi:MAG: sulfatase-like hydrolase/transferase [Sedimentisphaerales bacterium]|nr:sulfatase-like hydrolase/transferase [Sedimentisphaerales bacterium]
MNRRKFLKISAAATSAVALQSCTGLHGKADTGKGSPPNLLFLFADQLGYTRCGYAGDSKARTPNIDTLASQGADFFNAVSNTPVCAAYRASLFTGKYTTSTGMVINELRMRTDHRCFGHVLTDAGYRTAYIGKWHLYANELGNHFDPKNSFVPPGPNRLGFNGYWAAYNFHHRYYNAYYHTNSPEKIFYGQDVYEPDAQTDLMIDFLNASAKQPGSFAAFLSYGTPHDPWSQDNVPDEYRRMFQDVSLPNPPNYKDRNDKYADDWGRLNPDQRRDLQKWRRNYYAMAANLDHNIGRLLDTLKKTGLADNTIVVFTSDHGEMFGAQGRRAKNIFYEEAARIPFLISWPNKIPKGIRIDAPLSTVDMMPTILSLMDLEIPTDVEGTDLSRIARGITGPEPKAAFLQNTGACAAWENGHEWRALRDKRYTYAVYRVDKSELLFDNLNDPYQMNNLADDPQHAPTLDSFRRMLAEKMKSLSDNFELCTWYRDKWTDGSRNIIRAARG